MLFSWTLGFREERTEPTAVPVFSEIPKAWVQAFLLLSMCISYEFRNFPSNPFCHCKWGQTLTKNIFILPKYFSVCTSLQQHVYRLARRLHVLEDRWLLTPCCEWWRNCTWFPNGVSKQLFQDWDLCRLSTDDHKCSLPSFIFKRSAFKRHSKSVTSFSLKLKWHKTRDHFPVGARTRETLKGKVGRKWPYFRKTVIYIKGVGDSSSPSVENTFKVQWLLEVTVKILF